MKSGNSGGRPDNWTVISDGAGMTKEELRKVPPVIGVMQSRPQPNVRHPARRSPTMPPNETYQKRSSYGPAARLPNSPAKGYSNKLKVNSYYADGRGCGASENNAPRQYETRDVQKLKDTE